MKRSSAATVPASILNGSHGPVHATPFCHQSYTAAPPCTPHYFMRPRGGPKLGSVEFRRRMQEVGETLVGARTGLIYLVHSSFAALDSLSILTALARRYRAASGPIGRLATQLVDAEAQDAGSYTAAFATAFEQGINPSATLRPFEADFEEGIGRQPGHVGVRLASWSSENHHLGRADAAVRLIDELATLPLSAGERVLFWGHGHAGNVFALMSQLLSADAAALEEFFDAASVYYCWPMARLVDIPVWRRVRQLLMSEHRPLAERPCDWVTFGTPLRYGWKLRAGDKLMHFIHHRPADSGPAYLAKFPARMDDVLDGIGGDYLQQVAIAGTDTEPTPLVWRSWLANRRLGRLFEPQQEAAQLSSRLEMGARVPDCGTTLLVDYGASPGRPAEHLAGHAVYTRPEWLLFHAERVAQHLYGGTNARSRAA